MVQATSIVFSLYQYITLHSNYLEWPK